MSQDEHHEHDGGHELEGLNVERLFKVIGGSIVLLLVSIIGVTQLFYQQRAGIILGNSDYTFVEEQRAEEAKMLTGIQVISAEVAKDPKKLVAFAAPAGWVHPDDIAAGATAAPASAAPAADDGHAPGVAHSAGEAPAPKPTVATREPATVAKPAPVAPVGKPAAPDAGTKK
jgi:hypothetical protein